MKEIRVGSICGMMLTEESQLLARKTCPSATVYHNATRTCAWAAGDYDMAYWDINTHISSTHAFTLPWK
jgi:hypothetical protein